MKKINQILMLLLVVSLMLPALSMAESLVVYSGRSDKFVKPVMAAFTKATGIDVLVHSAKSTALLNKMRIEGSHTQADLFMSNDAGNLQMGSDLGLFRAVPAQSADLIAANLRAADNTWVGLSARARVLVVNTDIADRDWIDSVFDLADPRLKGKIGITHSANESFIAGTTVYMQSVGKDKTLDWLQGLRKNSEGKVFDKHSKVVSAVAQGKKTVGLVNHYYIYRHLAKHPDAPIAIVLPDQDSQGKDGMGVAWNIAGVAISRYTKKQAMAEKLVAFLLSDEGQATFAGINREYPVRADIAAASEVPPLSSFKVADVPMAVLGTKRNATIDLLEAAGMP